MRKQIQKIKDYLLKKEVGKKVEVNDTIKEKQIFKDTEADLREMKMNAKKQKPKVYYTIDDLTNFL